jgi:hypothetical protein
MKFHIWQYCPGSHSARALEDVLSIRGHQVFRSVFGPQANLNRYSSNGIRQGYLHINWGCVYGGGLLSSGRKNDMRSRRNFILNNELKFVSNKLHFFQTIPNGSTDYVPAVFGKEQAQVHLNNGATIVARTKLAAHSGDGIVLVKPSVGETPQGTLPNCQLYTIYRKKAEEYRIHFNRYSGLDFIVQQKRKVINHENVNWQIRNHHNGWIYSRENINLPNAVRACATRVSQWWLSNSSLDFGAMDIIYNNQYDQAYCLEINSAPGMEGQTIMDYATRFEQAYTAIYEQGMLPGAYQ